MQTNIKMRAVVGAVALSVAAIGAGAGQAVAEPAVPGTALGHAPRAQPSAVGTWESSERIGVRSVELHADGTFVLEFAYFCPPHAMCFAGPRPPERGTWTPEGAAVLLTGQPRTYVAGVDGDTMTLNDQQLHRVSPKQ
ncbi:hypothetical protein [Streptomyces violascens]|uniref:hypothetical protein n=1 Tax=Streptomyces violascens TaxID=67381 RepID=UPI00368DF6AA